MNLTFDPTIGFHEYRFDYGPGRVVFLADSEVLAAMEGENIPSSGGHLILQHWSNGNDLWSGGPPLQDSTLAISYVKAYFNSSLLERQQQRSRDCGESTKHGSVPLCPVFDVTAGNASTGGTFWSQDHEDNPNGNGVNRGNGEEDGDSSGVAWRRSGCSVAFVTTVLLISGFCSGVRVR